MNKLTFYWLRICNISCFMNFTFNAVTVNFSAGKKKENVECKILPSFFFTRDVTSKMSSRLERKNSLIAGKKCCDCPDYFSQLILRKPPQTSRIMMSRISPSLLQDGESLSPQVVIFVTVSLERNFQWNENALWSPALKSKKNLNTTHSIDVDINIMLFYFNQR